jgi:hypothetical protein
MRGAGTVMDAPKLKLMNSSELLEIKAGIISSRLLHWFIGSPRLSRSSSSGKSLRASLRRSNTSTERLNIYGQLEQRRMGSFTITFSGAVLGPTRHGLLASGSRELAVTSWTLSLRIATTLDTWEGTSLKWPQLAERVHHSTCHGIYRGSDTSVELDPARELDRPDPRIRAGACTSMSAPKIENGVSQIGFQNPRSHCKSLPLPSHGESARHGLFLFPCAHSHHERSESVMPFARHRPAASGLPLPGPLTCAGDIPSKIRVAQSSTSERSNVMAWSNSLWTQSKIGSIG